MAAERWSPTTCRHIAIQFTAETLILSALGGAAWTVVDE
jgi:hypothetical protein